MNRPMRLARCLPVLLTLLWAPEARSAEPCFVRLDNGQDLSGWHPSATNHHGPGDNWLVEEGALVGRQKPGQLGGILMTDQSYSDVEAVFEVKIDWGCDSGFFLRTTAGDRAYQACIDYLPDSSVGSIYGEGFNGGLLVMPYTLTGGGAAALKAGGQQPLFDVADWPNLAHERLQRAARAHRRQSAPLANLDQRREGRRLSGHAKAKRNRCAGPPFDPGARGRPLDRRWQGPLPQHPGARPDQALRGADESRQRRSGRLRRQRGRRSRRRWWRRRQRRRPERLGGSKQRRDRAGGHDAPCHP